MKCDCFIIIFYGEKTMDLFEYAKSKTLDQESPLASRLRPTTLDEVVGQQHIIGKNTLLYRAIKADKLTSVIFYGPPGTGKTTLAKVIANTTSAEFTQINATVAGKKDMEAVVKEAQLPGLGAAFFGQGAVGHAADLVFHVPHGLAEKGLAAVYDIFCQNYDLISR